MYGCLGSQAATGIVTIETSVPAINGVNQDNAVHWQGTCVGERASVYEFAPRIFAAADAGAKFESAIFKGGADVDAVKHTRSPPPPRTHTGTCRRCVCLGPRSVPRGFLSFCFPTQAVALYAITFPK